MYFVMKDFTFVYLFEKSALKSQSYVESFSKDPYISVDYITSEYNNFWGIPALQIPLKAELRINHSCYLVKCLM